MAANGFARKARACDEVLDTAPPHDRHAEEMLVRGIALQPEFFDELDLSADDFYTAIARRLFLAMSTRRENALPLDFHGILEELTATDSLAQVGGTSGLADLITGDPLPAVTRDYYRQVKGYSRRRQLRRIAEALLRDSCSEIETADVLAVHRPAIETLHLEAAGELPASSRAAVVNMSAIKSETIRWFWPARIPMGKLSLISGDPGCGKSLLTLDMAARATNGSLWPCSTDHAPRGRVLLVCCEDDAADTIRPRLEAAGADVGMVDLLPGVAYLDPQSGENRTRLINLPGDISLIDRLLGEGRYKLVVFDTLTGFLGKADNNSSTEVRNALTPLATLAAKHGTAIVGVQHLTKNATTAAKYRTNGSIAWTGVARSVLAVAPHSDDPDLRAVAGVKGNLSAPPQTLGYYIRQSGNGVPYIEWAAAPIETSADELLCPQADKRPDVATEWLRDFLASGPRTASEVQAAAEEANISERALRRAKQALGVKPRPDGYQGPSVWALPLGV